MTPRTPEQNRTATMVLPKSPATTFHSRSPSRATTSTRSSPVKKALLPHLLSATGTSPSKRLSGTVVSEKGGSATGAERPSQQSRETARYAKHLMALSAGLSTPGRRGVGGSSGFLNGGSSRFSASATAGAGLTSGAITSLTTAGSISSLFGSPSVLRDSNKDNISNNLTTPSTTPATPYSSSSSTNSGISDSKQLNANKALFLSSLSAISTTPKSVLGKRSISTTGMVPTTPSGATFATTTPSLFSSPLQLGIKTPKTPSTSISSSTPSHSPQRARGYGRVASMSGLPMSSKQTQEPPKSLAAQAASSLTRTISSGGLTTKLEVVTNDWLGSGTSPKRGRKVYNQGDRFIPNRTATNMSSAQAKLELVRHPSFSGGSELTDEASVAYSQQIAEACGINLDSRMLAFSAEPPSMDGSNGRDASSAVRKIYSRHPSFTRSNSNLLLKKRTILSSPEKVLDAPGLRDDYYLNLLDWSCSNIVAIGLDKSVFIWDAESGHAESLLTLTGGTDAIASVSWAYDGLYLAVGTFDGDTQIWDIETKTKVRSMTGHVARVGVLAWDKHILSSGCRDGSIWNHDVRIQNHKVAELINHTNEVCGLVWRADGQQLASGGNDNLVNIWDARTTAPRYTKSNHTAAVKALAWCPWQNNLLASGGGTYDKQIHFWNTSTGARVSTVNTGSQVTSIVWSTEYREFMSSHGYPDNNLSVYGYPSMNKVIDIPAHDSRILHTAISPDGQTVATVASDENLKFWKLFERQTKKDVKAKRNATLTRAGSFGGTLGDDEDDDRRGGAGGSGIGGVGGSGTTIKGKSISSMTRIR